MRRMTWMMCGLLAGVLNAADLLPNGGFEENANWRTMGTVPGANPKEAFAYESEFAHSGKRSLRVMDKWDFARTYPCQTVPAVKGAKGYRLTFWARAEKTHVFRAGIALPALRPDGSRYNAIWKEQEFTADTQWKQFSMEVASGGSVTGVLVLFGATGVDRKLTGTVWIDDAELAALDKAPVKKAAAPRPSARMCPILTASPQFSPDRVEKTADGLRLKPGVTSHEKDANPPPDVTFSVDAPKDGFYSVIMQVRDERPGTDCLLKLPGRPFSRIKMIRCDSASGRGRVIGVFPLNKGKNEVGLVLPDAGVVTQLECFFSGPDDPPAAAKTFRPPVTPKGRPRLLVTPERLERVRKNLAHPEMRNALARLREAAGQKRKLIAEPGCEVEYQRELQSQLVAQAFFALVENDTAKKREVAQTMFSYFTQLNGFPGGHHVYNIRDAIYSAAIVYDWCYDEFTPEQRKKLIESFYRLAIRLEPGWAPYRMSIVNGHGNGGQITIAPLAFAIACYDEDPEPFRLISHRVFTELVPVKAYEYRSPLHPQGSNYGSARLRADVFCAAAYRIACGKDIFDPNLYTTPRYWQMIDLPEDGYFEEGDMWGVSRPQNLGWSLLFAYEASRDAAVKGYYLAHKLDQEEPLFHLLLNDPDLKPVMPKDQVLPWSYYFGPFHGSLVARTGFYRDEAAVYCIGGLKHNANHAHADAGSFQIFFRGQLAADIGEYASTYGSTYDYNFNKRSIAHNMIRVYDPSERFGRDNDGGSRGNIPMVRSPEDYEKDPRLDYGTNRAVSIGPDKMRPAYTVMASDLTHAYSKKMVHYMRLFVFLNQSDPERPATFITCDLVESAKAEFPKIYQVSTWRKPEIAEGFIGLATDQGGRADMHLYLPKKHRITDYSGLDSIRNALTGFQNKVPTVPGGIGRQAHRLEVTPAESRAFDTFLAHFGIRGERAARHTQGYTELANAHLVRSGKFLVTLPKKDELISTPLVFDVPQGGAQVLCVYLAPGKWHAAGYNFTVKGSEHTLFLAAPAGTLHVAPGELAGKPEYRVPAECTPPAPKGGDAILLDGKAYPGEPVFDPRGILIPADSLPGLPKFTEKTTSVAWNGLDIPVKPAPRVIDGKLYIPADLAAGLLHARLVPDAMSGRVRLFRLPDNKPAIVAADAAVDGGRIWRLLYARPRPGGSWAATWDRSRFTLTFDRPVKLGAMAITYAYGDIRDFPVKLEVSADGKNYHRVFDGMSAHQEKLSVFRWKPEMVRSIRYLGSGTTLKTWTCIEKIDFPE